MLRTCLACSQTDDHPRHEILLQVQPELLVAGMHLDCCAQVRGCESCKAQTEGAAGKTGEAMRQHIIEFNQSQGRAE